MAHVYECKEVESVPSTRFPHVTHVYSAWHLRFWPSVTYLVYILLVGYSGSKPGADMSSPVHPDWGGLYIYVNTGIHVCVF